MGCDVDFCFAEPGAGLDDGIGLSDATVPVNRCRYLAADPRRQVPGRRG